MSPDSSAFLITAPDCLTKAAQGTMYLGSRSIVVEKGIDRSLHPVSGAYSKPTLFPSQQSTVRQELGPERQPGYGILDLSLGSHSGHSDPISKSSTTFPGSTTPWGPSIQRNESIRDISHSKHSSLPYPILHKCLASSECQKHSFKLQKSP